ncbi:MAG: hypothetical protein M3279_11730 [Actinomycetota bacterium]|nr:hypothetical protein [Actinomycetota bacterium]
MRRAAGLAAIMILVGAVACGDKPPGGSAAEDYLYFESPRGVSVVAAGAKTAERPAPGIPSTDWSSVVTYRRSGGVNHLQALDARAGDVQWKRDIDGPPLQVKVVSRAARMVALTPFDQYHYMEGRKKTTIVVTGRDAPPQTVELDGNYEPEAFSNDGESVFLLEYLPPQRPNSYRVRRLDLSTKEVLGVYSVDAELQERMRGTARIQSMSPDGKYLYTLYTTGGGRLGPRRAFIHVLNLDELWAHCIDLPPEFGQVREPQIAITVTPDSKRLYINDVGAGTMAEVDTQSLDVLRTGSQEVATSAYKPRGIHDGDHTLYLARGPFLSAIDTNTLSETETWTMPATIRGVQVAADASKVYVALARQVVTLDAATGKELEVVNPPGVGRIHRMGPVMRKVESAISKLTCAC